MILPNDLSKDCTIRYANINLISIGRVKVLQSNILTGSTFVFLFAFHPLYIREAAQASGTTVTTAPKEVITAPLFFVPFNALVCDIPSSLIRCFACWVRYTAGLKSPSWVMYKTRPHASGQFSYPFFSLI